VKKLLLLATLLFASYTAYPQRVNFTAEQIDSAVGAALDALHGSGLGGSSLPYKSYQVSLNYESGYVVPRQTILHNDLNDTLTFHKNLNSSDTIFVFYYPGAVDENYYKSDSVQIFPSTPIAHTILGFDAWDIDSLMITISDDNGASGPSLFKRYGAELRDYRKVIPAPFGP